MLKEILRIILGDKKECKRCHFEYICDTDDGSFYECKLCGNEVLLSKNCAVKQSRITDCDYD